MAERGHANADALLDRARACLAVAEQWDPAGYVEHCATASAAGIDEALLYAASNMTDVRDIVLLSPADAEGCSVALLPPASTKIGSAILAQTWDLNPADLDFVVAVHRVPEDGPETWAITCTGCPSLIGLNALGVAVGTTNIKTRGSRVGVGYLTILQRALCAEDRGAAVRAVEQAPRAAGHTYWIGDAAGASELECSADRCVRRDTDDAPICRTNHCLAPELGSLEGEAPTESSKRRLLRLEQVARRGHHDAHSLKGLFADRSDGVDSINRYVEDEQGTSTNACVIILPNELKIWACRGPADRGRWVELSFDGR
jgi:hypothetical protein